MSDIQYRLFSLQSDDDEPCDVELFDELVPQLGSDTYCTNAAETSVRPVGSIDFKGNLCGEHKEQLKRLGVAM